MTTTAKYMCPDCGSIDLVIKQGAVTLLDAAGDKLKNIDTRCPNCSWSGSLSDAVGTVTNEAVWDIERISKVLLRLVTAQLSGPLMQAFKFIGLVEDDDQEGKDYIMSHVVAAVVETAFTAAHDVYLKKQVAELEEDQKPKCPKCHKTTINLTRNAEPLQSPQNRAACRSCDWEGTANKLTWPWLVPKDAPVVEHFAGASVLGVPPDVD